MTPEQERKLDAVCKSVVRIERRQIDHGLTLLGSPPRYEDGLVSRVAASETKHAELERGIRETKETKQFALRAAVTALLASAGALVVAVLKGDFRNP